MLDKFLLQKIYENHVCMWLSHTKGISFNVAHQKILIYENLTFRNQKLNFLKRGAILMKIT